MTNSLWPHGLQCARLPCPSPSPWVCSNSCSLSQWSHSTISSSVSPSPLALNLSQHQGLFQWVSSLHHTAKVLISFRIDWFDLLAVQGTLKILLQHHSLKVSFLWCSAFFVVQLSHPYMTPGKPIAYLVHTDEGLEKDWNGGYNSGPLIKCRAIFSCMFMTSLSSSLDVHW